VVITVSNRYGCGAIAVAQLAADRLGYTMVDEQLPIVVATRLQTSAQAVESAEDTGKSMSERMLQALEWGTPELRAAQPATFDEDCLRELQEAVREFARQGNVILIGRGAHAILGRGPQILRVFMHAPRGWRVRRIAESHGLDERSAGAEVDRIDRAREQYIRSYYEIQWSSPDNYDLTIDTSTFGIEASAEMLVCAVNSR
jgi:cytidylate kinase